MNCERCGKEQTPGAYCVKWRDGECIRMESVAPSIDDFDIDDQDIQAVVDDYNDRRELREVKE